MKTRTSIGYSQALVDASEVTVPIGELVDYHVEGARRSIGLHVDTSGILEYAGFCGEGSTISDDGTTYEVSSCVKVVGGGTCCLIARTEDGQEVARLRITTP